MLGQHRSCCLQARRVRASRPGVGNVLWRAPRALDGAKVARRIVEWHGARRGAARGPGTRGLSPALGPHAFRNAGHQECLFLMFQCSCRTAEAGGLSLCWAGSSGLLTAPREAKPRSAQAGFGASHACGKQTRGVDMGATRTPRAAETVVLSPRWAATHRNACSATQQKPVGLLATLANRASKCPAQGRTGQIMPAKMDLRSMPFG